MRDSQNNRVRPNFELLEDRTTPASVTVTTLTDVSDGDTTSVANLKASPGPDGAISLREAITAINTSTDLNNQITFGGDNAVDGDINLTSELNVSKNLTITGPGSGPALDVRILGTLGQVDPFVAGKRVFTVTGGKTLELQRLVVTRGGTSADADINGGLIKVETGGKLVLRNSVVSFGTAKGDGGGIWVGSGGRLELHGATVEDNEALGNGGGIAVAGGAASENAVWITSDPLIGENQTWSKIDFNTAGKDGGGLYLTGSGNVTQPPAINIDKATITFNDADGGFGGGMYLGWMGNTSGNKPVLIQNTEVTDNYAKLNGGGIDLAPGGDTKFGGGVKVNENKSEEKDGVSIYARHAKVDGRDLVEEKNNRYLPPPGDDGTPPSSQYIDLDSEFDFAGAVDMISDPPGAGEVAAITLRNAGILNPGGTGGIGLITLMGSYDQTGTGQLNIDLADGGYDQIHATADGTLVSLAGALNLTATWTADPAIGTKFTIIQNDTSSATSGEFAGYPDGTIITIGTVSLQITYNRASPDDTNDVILEVIDPGSGGSGGSGGSISGVSWEDTNADGIRDAEPLLTNVQVNLLDEFGTVIDFMFTGQDGSYGFFLLGEGTYRIQFVLPSESPGFTTQDKDQNQFDTVDSDVDSAGVTMPLILGPDQELLNIDAGLLAASSGGSGA